MVSAGLPEDNHQQKENHLTAWLGIGIALAALIVNIAMLIVMIRQGRTDSRRPGGRHRKR